jgi:hypothetical protein
LRNLGVSLLSVTAVLLSQGPAWSQPSASDRAAAETLFDQALALMEAGKPAEACPKLEESQRLDPGVGTLLYLASCYEKSARAASAWATFVDAAYAAKNAGDTSRQQVAEENAARLKPLLPKLLLEVASPEATGLRVQSDGRDVSRALWGSEMPVDAGSHRIEASADGKKPWSGEVVIPVEGGVTRFTVPALEDAPVAAPAVAPPVATPTEPQPPATPKDSADSGSSQRTWGWISVAGGSALVVGGGVFAALAVSANGQADDACRPDEPALCSADGVDLAETARRRATIAGVLGGVGLAAAATGLVLVFTAKDDSAARLEVAPTWTADGGGLLVEGRF